MRKLILTTILVLASALTAFAQTIYICKDGDYTTRDISDGLEISLREFFNSELFDDLEQEIK